MNKYLTPAVRRWIYGLALAGLPVLIYFGLVEVEAAPLWLAFIVALLNVQDDAPAPTYRPQILGKALYSDAAPAVEKPGGDACTLRGRRPEPPLIRWYRRGMIRDLWQRFRAWRDVRSLRCPSCGNVTERGPHHPFCSADCSVASAM